MQYATVQPNTNYKISFNVYLGDDVVGALRPDIYTGIPGHPHITGPAWNTDDLVIERGKFGTRVGIDLAGGTAQLSQSVRVQSNRNLEFSAAMRSSGPLRGSVNFLSVALKATWEIKRIIGVEINQRR